jgi:trimethylamine---corrinoid protein Co-methyltransferase
MAMRGFDRRFKPFEILTDEQIEAIHKSVIQVLEETGLAFHDKRALNIFAEHGCKVDFPNERVRFPEWIVEDCLAKSPKSFRVKARDPKNDIILSGGGPTYFACSSGYGSLDLDTWEYRSPTRKDYYDFIKVLDALPNVHSLSAFPYFGFAKVPQCMCLLEGNAANIRMSSKTQMQGTVGDNDTWNIKMAKAVGMDLLSLVNPAAPLSYYDQQVTCLLKYVEEGVPFHFASGPVMGATAPATIAGGMVTPYVESFGGLVLAQLVKPGTRLWVGNYANVQNMRSGSPDNGAIANSLHEVVFNQVARRYNLPTWSSSSAWTSSKQFDFQSGYEQGMAAILCGLAGANYLFLQCGFTAQLATHPVKAIMDDDIAGMVGRFLGGIEVNDETLAVDLINEVGPIPGMFLNKAHTRKWWKTEQYIPPLADKMPYLEWVKKGKKTIIDRARQRMEEIISTHKPAPLTPQQDQALEDILKEAREYYRKKGLISDQEWKVYQEDLASPNYPYA